MWSEPEQYTVETTEVLNSRLRIKTKKTPGLLERKTFIRTWNQWKNLYDENVKMLNFEKIYAYCSIARYNQF